MYKGTRLVPFLVLIVMTLFGCSKQIATLTDVLDGKTMVRVDAGEFQMGTNPQQAADLEKKLSLQANALQSEGPAQTLSLPEFYIDRTPVTNAEYKKFIDANPAQAVPYLDDPLAQAFNWDKTTRTFPASRDQYPAVLVTWHDAEAYCKWAGSRLPTEAEWEKAARGTDGRLFPWGNTWNGPQASAVQGQPQDAAPVGQNTAGASPYGALDMVANVWQWTSSLDKPYPYNANDGREDPQAPGMRIVRGGAWLFGPAFTRTAIRNRFDPNGVSLSIGFRCAA